jgi:hypothetical protein
VKTGIQKDIARHDLWIPTYVGMTKRLKNNTFDTRLTLSKMEHQRKSLIFCLERGYFC